MTNPLRRLEALGQSVWLDDLRREWLDDGTLQTLIRRDGVSGLTTNPAIFAQAVESTDQYLDDIAGQARSGAGPEAIYEHLVIDDVRRAADLLRSVYDRTGGADGYVSLEVSPHLAHDTAATIEQARRFWDRVDRPNLMIKVPGTSAGLPTVRVLIADGINVNVTLLFSAARYAEVVDCHRQGLVDRAARSLPLDGVASVASFFLSRIDTHVDALLDATPGTMAAGLRGQAALACAGSAYAAFLAAESTAHWQALAHNGAQRQRLLWASTSAKDPAYAELKYVEPLVGPSTVTTLPLATLSAYRQRGEPARRLQATMTRAERITRALAACGIDLDRVAADLEREGLEKFTAAYDRLLERIDEARSQALRR